MKLRVKIDNLDSELMYKRLNISIGNTTIFTPLKVSNKSISISEVNEIYKEFSIEKLDKMVADENIERAVNFDVRNELADNINIFIPNYTSLEIPKPNHIEALSDLQYQHSPIVVTPIWSKLVRSLKGDDLLHTFIDLTNKYIDIVETLNDKTIIGVIPSRMPRQFLREILDNYCSNNITSFIIDFDGRTIDSNPSWIRNLMRVLSSYGLIDNCFLYSINANEGKFLKNAMEIPAKDFISMGFGIDILGLTHVRPRMPTEIWKKVAQERKENTFRLFDSNNYAYTKQAESSLRDLWGLSGPGLRNEIKRRNIKEQYTETQVLQQKIKEEDTIEPYIKTKVRFDETFIKKIKSIRKGTFSGDEGSADI